MELNLRRTIGVLLALLGLTVAAAPARAEIAFSPPQVFATDGGGPVVAMDPQGRSTIVWAATAKGGSFFLVRAVQLDASETPGPVHTLATIPMPPEDTMCVCPQVAVDSSGRATAVWQTFDQEVRRIQSAQFDPAGNSDPTQLVSPRFLNAAHPQLAVDGEGWVTIVYETEWPKVRIEAVRLDPQGVRGEPQILSEWGSSPAVAVGPEGTPHVSWTGKEGVESTALDAEGAAVGAQLVSPPGEDAGAADIVVDSKGRPTIGWWRGLGVYEAKAVRLDADGTPGTVWNLSPPGQAVLEPILAVDLQDRVTAVWESFEESVWTVRLGADGVPGTVHNLSGEGTFAGRPQVATAADGRAVVAWAHMPYAYLIPPEGSCSVDEFHPEYDRVRAAVIAPDGQPESTYDVSSYGEQSISPQLAMNSQGLIRVTWMSFDGTYACWEKDTRLQTSQATLAEPPVVDPPSEPPTGPPAPPLPPVKATLRIAKKAVVKKSRVVLRARCAGVAGTVCAGPLELSLRSRLTLARGRYRMAGGESRKLSLALSNRGKRLVESGRRQINVKAKGRGIAADVVLVRLPQPH
jgi:hypothetical protein